MKRITLRAACILLMLAAAASCKKASDSRPAPDAGNPTLKAISGRLGFSQWPKVEDGMLVFNSEAHFEKYIAFLDAAVDPENYDSVRTNKQGDTLEFDQDKILEDIEAALGFTSVRKISHDHFLKLNEVGWDRLEDIPEEHFIRDAVMRSVLNPDLSVKIGGNFVHVINRSLSVQVDASQAELLQTFGELPESATLQDVLLIDPTRQYSKVFEIDGAGVFSTFGKTPGAAHTLGAGDVTIIKPKVATPDCNNPRKVVFSDMRMYQQGQYSSSTQGYLSGSFEVDFGDGTSGTYYTYNQNGIEVCETFEHTYATPGVYTYTIDGTPSSVLAGYTQNLAYMTDDVTVSNSMCTNVNIEGAEEFYAVGDGSRAVSGKITVSIWTPIPFGAKQRQVLSETSSWFRVGNKWKQSKAEIWGNLHTERKDKDCNVLGQVDGDGWSSKSKHIQVHRRDLPYFWSTVNTNHGIKYHNVWYSLPKSLNSCQ